MATTPLFIHPTLTGAAIPFYVMFPVEPTPSDDFDKLAQNRQAGGPENKARR